MLHHVEYDLAAREPQRLAAVFEASEDWDPAGVDELDELLEFWSKAA